ENPAVREGFFPSDVYLYSVEPSRSEDAKAILSIIRKHEGREGAQALIAWWHALPTCFRVVRGPDTEVAGFYVAVDAEAVPPSLLRADPVARRWAALLRKDPVPRGQRMLFCRRWLSLNVGEGPSPAQGACWLDIKREYMELRPHLRRIATTMRDPTP